MKDNAQEPERPSLFGAAMATYGTHVAVSVLSLVSVLIVARVLGATGRGEVAFLITIATLSSQFALLGIPDANGNIAGARPETRPQLASNSLIFAAGFGLMVAALVGALADLIPGLTGELDRELVWVALAAIPLGIARWCLNLLVQADYAFVATNRAWLAGPLTTVVEKANGVMAILGELTVTTSRQRAHRAAQAAARKRVRGDSASRLDWAEPGSGSALRRPWRCDRGRPGVLDRRRDRCGRVQPCASGSAPRTRAARRRDLVAVAERP